MAPFRLRKRGSAQSAFSKASNRLYSSEDRCKLGGPSSDADPSRRSQFKSSEGHKDSSACNSVDSLGKSQQGGDDDGQSTKSSIDTLTDSSTPASTTSASTPDEGGLTPSTDEPYSGFTAPPPLGTAATTLTDPAPPDSVMTTATLSLADPLSPSSSATSASIRAFATSGSSAAPQRSIVPSASLPSSQKFSNGAIAGIVVGSIVGQLLLFAVVGYLRRRKSPR